MAEGVALGVVSNALYDILRGALGAVRRRSGSSRELVASLAGQGVVLDRAETRRFIRWVETIDLDRLTDASTDPTAQLVGGLSAEVFGTGSRKRQDVGSRSKELAERLQEALWPALSATLAPAEVRALRTAVAALHTEQLASSVLAELGWLREAVDELPRMLDPSLPLERAWLRLAPGVAVHPYHLLWPRSAIVPFEDRGGWLDTLAAWCEADDRISVHIIVGTGGMGKTRLALELCRRMASRGWLTGLYQPVSDAAISELAAQPLPRLVVLDYADVRPDVARDLIGRLADRLPLRPHRVRILLIVRRVSERRNPRRWFTGPSDRISQLVDAANVLSLSEATGALDEGLHEGVFFGVGARQRLFMGAAAAFSAYFQTPRAADMPALDEPTYNSPLFVLMAALISVDPDTDPVPAGVGPDELLDRILEREEKRHWVDLEESMTMKRRAVAVGTLFGADDEDEALGHLASLGSWTDRAQQVRVAEWLHGLYEGPRWLNPLEPDLLGEYLVSQNLTESMLDRVVTVGTSVSAIRAFTVLSRLVAARPAVRDEVTPVLRRALPDLASAVVEQERSGGLDAIGNLIGPLTAVVEQVDLGDMPEAEEFDDALPITGNPLAVAIGRQAVHHARRQAETMGSPDADARLARSLDNLSVRLSELGLWDEAVAGSREAVGIHRRLAERHHGRVSDLAAALNDLSNWLGELGQRHDGLAAIQEVVALYRIQAVDDPSLLASLAAALNNLSVRLADVGIADDGAAAPEGAVVAPLQEAVSIYRLLAEDNPDAYLPDLAAALTNLSETFGELGRSQDGLTASEEAVAIYRDLVNLNPGAYPNLATALNTLSIRLGEMDRLEHGLAVLEEAVEIRRRMADVNPAAHLSHLGLALSNLAADLGQLDRPREGLVAVEEAISIRRQLAAANRAANLPDLATALRNKASILNALGRTDEGLAALEEAVEACRTLVAAYPDAHLPDLAAALNNLSVDLAQLDRTDEALIASEEAVATYRRLAEANEIYRQDLALALNNLSVDLAVSDRSEDGLIVSEEAVALYRRLTHGGSTRLVGLASALNNMSMRLTDVDRTDHALAAVEEAVDIFRRIPHLEADDDRADLAAALNNYSMLLGAVAREDEGLAAAEDAVTIYRSLARNDSAANSLNLATALANQASCLHELGRTEEALRTLEEAIALQSQFPDD